MNFIYSWRMCPYLRQNDLDVAFTGKKLIKCDFVFVWVVTMHSVQRILVKEVNEANKN